MRAITRIGLSAANLVSLNALTQQVTADSNPKAKAASLWNNKPDALFNTVRTTLRKMAGGRERCMYCEDNEGTDIEHFYPKSAFPDKAFVWENYLLACAYCNSNCKRSKFPMSGGNPALINPLDEDPAIHIRLVPSNGRYNPTGPKGQPSIEVFDLNGDKRGRHLPEGRRDTLRKLQLLVLDFAEQLRSNNATEAQATKDAILREPFPAVFRSLIQISKSPGGKVILRDGVVDAIDFYGMDSWCP
jgi:uncharacterized protein (TIGR02646 family)